MSRILQITLVVLALFFFLSAGGQEEKVTLEMGSWRTDDTEKMNEVIALFEAEYPEISVSFEPTNPPDYNASLRLRLESGTGPDIFYARSYATGVQLYEDGFMLALNDWDVLDQTYADGAQGPWTSGDGSVFAMPFLAVSHGVYYNQDIFEELNLSIPTTWDEFISVAQTIKDAGYIPVANALADQWDITEVVFMNIAPNFIGGQEGREAYDNSERTFNDEYVVSLFEAIDSLQPFLPNGYEAIGYNDSKALFQLGDAAMMFDGSWTIKEHEDAIDAFKWGIFAPPSPTDEQYITFHPDNGIAINPATDHPQEAKLFLEWLAGDAGSKAVADQLPGFFPMKSNPPVLNNAYSNEFLGLNKGRGLDVRWTWPSMMEGNPSGYQLIQEASVAVLTDRATPTEAANSFQDGLALWYAPAQ